MTSGDAARGLGREIPRGAAGIDVPASGPEPPPLTPEQCSYVRFVLDVVGELAARHGFDPAELIDPRSGASLGPALGRMRGALERTERDRVRGDGARAGQRASDRPR